MYTQVNREEMRREWVLTNFWDKAVFCVGVIMTTIFSLAFISGLIDGLL